jgi:hypothetical protein
VVRGPPPPAPAPGPRAPPRTRRPSSAGGAPLAEPRPGIDLEVGPQEDDLAARGGRPGHQHLGHERPDPLGRKVGGREHGAAGPIAEANYSDEADALAETAVVDGTVLSQVVAQASPAVSVERTQNHMMDVTPAGLGLKMPATPVDRATSSCPQGMVEVEGDYCPNIEQKCLRWLDPEKQLRCAEFAPTGACQGKTIRKRFCMDRFEYPNIAGERPVVMKTFWEAKSTCESQGKRLCGESEWTLACEGQERLPYPYGHARNAEACNIDKPYLLPDEKAIANPQTRDAEVARLDQREPSGGRESCVSPFGVQDMTGNVDEWVINESGKPYQSGLKGGYWGPVRTRCRPMTTAHNEDFSFYQIGFRCCGDVPGAASTARAPAQPAQQRAAASKKPEVPPTAKAKAAPTTPPPAS